MYTSIFTLFMELVTLTNKQLHTKALIIISFYQIIGVFITKSHVRIPT